MVARDGLTVIEMLQKAHDWAEERRVDVYGYGLSGPDYRRYREELWREMNFLGGVEMPPDLHTNPQRPDLAFCGGRVFESPLADVGAVRVETESRYPGWTPARGDVLLWNLDDPA